MNNKSLIGLVAVVALLVSVATTWGVNKLTSNITGGDFAGGITPSQFFTGNASTNSVTPNLSNLYLNGGISVGGTGANNQIPVVYTATTAYPVSSNVNLGPLVSSTSTATTTVSFNAAGFSVGDACEISYNGVTSTPDAFGADGFVTAVSGNAVTTTVTFWNGAGRVTTLTVTSTVTSASSTLKATCFHTGV